MIAEQRAKSGGLAHIWSFQRVFLPAQSVPRQGRSDDPNFACTAIGTDHRRGVGRVSPVIEESVVLPRVSRGKGVSVTGTLRGLPAAVAESPCPEAHSGLRMPRERRRAHWHDSPSTSTRSVETHCTKVGSTDTAAEIQFAVSYRVRQAESMGCVPHPSET